MYIYIKTLTPLLQGQSCRNVFFAHPLVCQYVMKHVCGTFNSKWSDISIMSFYLFLCECLYCLKHFCFCDVSVMVPMPRQKFKKKVLYFSICKQKIKYALEVTRVRGNWSLGFFNMKQYHFSLFNAVTKANDKNLKLALNTLPMYKIC